MLNLKHNKALSNYKHYRSDGKYSSLKAGSKYTFSPTVNKIQRAAELLGEHRTFKLQVKQGVMLVTPLTLAQLCLTTSWYSEAAPIRGE